MVNVLQFFTAIMVAQIFFSVGINVITYTSPPTATSYFTNIFGINTADLTSLQTQLQGSLAEQSSMPLVELGALAFYSGNVILDLILNFAFALPEMVSIVLQSISLLFMLDPTIMNWIQVFIFVTFTVLYFFGIIGLLAAIRTGRIGSG